VKKQSIFQKMRAVQVVLAGDIPPPLPDVRAILLWIPDKTMFRQAMELYADVRRGFVRCGVPQKPMPCDIFAVYTSRYIRKAKDLVDMMANSKEVRLYGSHTDLREIKLFLSRSRRFQHQSSAKGEFVYKCIE